MSREGKEEGKGARGGDGAVSVQCGESDRASANNSRVKDESNCDRHPLSNPVRRRRRGKPNEELCKRFARRELRSRGGVLQRRLPE